MDNAIRARRRNFISIEEDPGLPVCGSYSESALEQFRHNVMEEMLWRQYRHYPNRFFKLPAIFMPISNKQHFQLYQVRQGGEDDHERKWLFA